MIPTMWHEHPSYGHPVLRPVLGGLRRGRAWWCTPTRARATGPSYNENIAQFVLEVPFWTHRPLWQLLLSGKFDRFPDLRYAVVECGSYWLGDLLWKADTTLRRQPQGEEAELADQGPDPAAAVGVRRAPTCSSARRR